MDTKICKSCNKEYPATLEFFHKDSSGKLGFKAKCKACINSEKFRFVNKGNHLCKSCGRELPFTDEYFVNNTKSNKLTSPCRECRGLKFGKIKYKNKKSRENYKIADYKECKICKKIYLNVLDYFCLDTHYKDNLSKVCCKCTDIRKKLTLKIKRHNMQIKRKNDIQLRLANNIRTRIKNAIKNNSKSGKSLKLLGCNILEYKKYLENLMSKEMTWENYGKVWHIDHIIPCCKFKLSIEKNQYKCFNYTNTQPMFALDNLSKQGCSVFKVIYKSSKNYENNNFIKTNNCIIDER